jgi:hypothetical protein
MAEGRTQGTKSGSDAGNRNGSRKAPIGVMNGAHEAAELVKSTAERAAEYWPEAVAGAQTYARDTRKALDQMPNQGLVIGTSFSLGLGVGLFMSGANRLLVLLSLAPAAAMAATLLSRNESES